MASQAAEARVAPPQALDINALDDAQIAAIVRRGLGSVIPSWMSAFMGLSPTPSPVDAPSHPPVTSAVMGPAAPATPVVAAAVMPVVTASPPPPPSVPPAVAHALTAPSVTVANSMPLSTTIVHKHEDWAFPPSAPGKDPEVDFASWARATLPKLAGIGCGEDVKAAGILHATLTTRTVMSLVSIPHLQAAVVAATGSATPWGTSPDSWTVPGILVIALIRAAVARADGDYSAARTAIQSALGFAVDSTTHIRVDKGGHSDEWHLTHLPSHALREELAPKLASYRRLLQTVSPDMLRHYQVTQQLVARLPIWMGIKRELAARYKRDGGLPSLAETIRSITAYAEHKRLDGKERTGADMAEDELLFDEAAPQDFARHRRPPGAPG